MWTSGSLRNYKRSIEEREEKGREVEKERSTGLKLKIIT